jgi:hypothetical protein
VPAGAVGAALPGPGTRNGARTLGPCYGDLEGPGELERTVRLVSSEGELVLSGTATSFGCGCSSTSSPSSTATVPVALSKPPHLVQPACSQMRMHM